MNLTSQDTRVVSHDRIEILRGDPLRVEEGVVPGGIRMIILVRLELRGYPREGFPCFFPESTEREQVDQQEHFRGSNSASRGWSVVHTALVQSSVSSSSHHSSDRTP